MSTQMRKDVGCPKCGAAVRTQMWPGICAQENPELRTSLLDETLFDWKCPVCGYSAQFVYPCLYHDREHQFMVYMAPGGSGEFQPVDISKKFPQLAEVKKRVVASPAELKEKILIFEAGLDDSAVELVKYALADVLKEKRGVKTAKGYFSFASDEENRIGFVFFPEGQETPVIRKTSMDAYRKSLEIVNAYPSDEGNSFVPVDCVTARRLLTEFRGSTESADKAT